MVVVVMAVSTPSASAQKAIRGVCVCMGVFWSSVNFCCSHIPDIDCRKMWILAFGLVQTKKLVLALSLCDDHYANMLRLDSRASL